MALKRPLGVTLWGIFFTLTGGVSLLVLLVEILIYVGNSGFQSLLIINLQGLMGFFLYAVIPVFFYTLGMGLFLLRPWARLLLIFVNPVLLQAYLINIGCHISKVPLYGPVDLLMIPGRYPQLFMPILFIGAVLILSSILYFTKREISRYF